MKVLGEGPAVSAGMRPASALLHDEANARVVAFHLAPGQEVPPHTSDSTVIVHVVRGAGVFRGAVESLVLRAGQTAVFAPGEVHGMTAGDEPLLFLAVIAPAPPR